jgi:hypothetical protein
LSPDCQVGDEASSIGSLGAPATGTIHRARFIRHIVSLEGIDAVYQEPTYPTVRFIVRYQRIIVSVAALLPIVAVLAFTLPDFHWNVILAAVVAGAVVGFFVQSYVEIVRVIADTLLPR